MSYCGLEQRYSKCEFCGMMNTHDDYCTCHECADCGRNIIDEDFDLCDECRLEGGEDD